MVSDSFLVNADAIALTGDSGVSPTNPVVTINDGSIQRSMINSITVSFGQVVNNLGTFTLLDKTTNTYVGLRLITEILNGQTVVMLQFTGTGIVGGSLANGLTSCTTTGPLAASFFRLFGDSNGDGLVNETDLTAFSNALAPRWERRITSGT